jgi:two-component system CheB/CheR fusion protein
MGTTVPNKDVATPAAPDGLRPPWVRLWRRYGVPGGLSVLALLISLPLWSVTEKALLFPFVSAVLAAAWYGGRRAGLIATIFSTLVIAFFQFEPFFSPYLRTPGDGIALVVFVLVALAISLFVGGHRHAELLRAAREAEFRAIFELAAAGKAQADPLTGRYLRVNQRLCEITGYSVAEMLERTFTDVTHPDDRAHDLEQVGQALRGETDGWVTEKRYVRKDGQIVWVLVTGRLLRDARGRPRSTVATILDVTDRKHAEQELRASDERHRALAEALRASEARFQLALASGAVTVFEQDLNLRYTWVYPQGPVSPDPNIGHTDAELITGPEGEELLRLKRQVLETGQGVRRTMPVPLQHEMRYYDLLIEPRRDGQGHLIGVGGAALDVTARKLIEEALKAEDQRKDEFLATLAHELRNPLAPIRNALQILQAPPASATDLEWARGIIERQVLHLVRLVDDLLDVSRITRGRIELRKELVSLSTVVERALETSRPLLEASGHQLDVNLPAEPLFLEADVTRLAQVLANLLNNAAKYTRAGGHIQLTATRLDSGFRLPDATTTGTRNDGPAYQATIRQFQAALDESARRYRAIPQVEISVRDDGVGIPAKMLSRIFEMFIQVDTSLERAQGGLGIGLTIVKQLVEMHGGTVRARSDGPESGSEFLVRLPLASAPSAGDDPAPVTRIRRNGHMARRVLVVDDNHDAARSLSVLLKLAGHEVHVVHDGLQALHEAQAFLPDFVLLDIGLPGMNGYDVARRLRTVPQLKDMVLVAQTGWGQEEDRRRSQEAGFDHHLVKPVDLEVLQTILAS